MPFLKAQESLSQNPRELMQTLREHGYGRRSFNDGFVRNVPEPAFQEGVRKFKTALDKTRHVRDFSSVRRIYISRRETIHKSNTFNDGTFSLYFPAYEPAEAYIGLLSSAPEREPDFQRYAQQKRIKVDQNLEPQFGRWFALHKMGEQVLCHHLKGKEYPDTARVRQIAEELLGEQVQEVEFEHHNLTYEDGERKTLQIQIDSPLMSEIVVETITDEEGEEEYFYIRLYGSEGENLISSSYNFACNLKNARTWKYREHDNGRKLLWKRQWFDTNGEVSRTVYANRGEQTLEDIYQSNQYERPFSELEFISQRTDRVLVTILDSGVDYNHLDLAFKIWRTPEGRMIGRDYQDFDGLPYDYEERTHNTLEIFDHGTHVAGIATRGSDDIAILPIRYPRRKKENFFYDAIAFAHEQGSRIVNISLGNKEARWWHSLNRAIRNHPDMLFVVGAGNDGLNLDEEPFYPAGLDHPNMIVVASVDEKANLSYFSNYGQNKVDVAALGERTLSLNPENSRGKRKGTSMATPYVTRIAAKASFINPALGPQQIIDLIGASVTKVPALADKVKYCGVANEERALELARETLKL